MNAQALGFHEEEQVASRARACLHELGEADQVPREEYVHLLSEYEKLSRQGMRLVKMGDRMQQKLADLNAALERKQEELQRLAATDMLTGLCNRRAFLETAHRELAQALRRGRPLSVFLLDADHFKRVNDTYGHDAGDRALRHIAVVGTAALRTGDLLARFGGEEFVALLPDAGPEAAVQAAERVRLALRESVVAAAGARLTITASVGVASLSTGVDTLDRLLKHADQALYDAKAAGRDRVLLHAPSA